MKINKFWDKLSQNFFFLNLLYHFWFNLLKPFVGIFNTSLSLWIGYFDKVRGSDTSFFVQLSKRRELEERKMTWITCLLSPVTKTTSTKLNDNLNTGKQRRIGSSYCHYSYSWLLALHHAPRHHSHHFSEPRYRCSFFKHNPATKIRVN